MKTPYAKTYKSPAALIALLKNRGMEIQDDAKAESYLMRIGYYRLSGYWYPLLQEPKAQHVFKPKSSFKGALSLYHFDRKLRLLVFNEIEKIEVAVRAAMTNIMAAETQDPFWLTNPKNYHNASKFHKSLTLIDKELSHSTEDFITHFRTKYVNPYPPAWMLMEILPFGILSRVYENLVNFKARKRIAAEFGLNIPVFLSWITVLANTRNTCCHHGRLWNRQFALRTLSVKGPGPISNANQYRLYYRLCIIKTMLDVISPRNDMLQHLQDLLAQYQMVDVAAMGFPMGWEKEPLWQRKL